MHQFKVETDIRFGFGALSSLRELEGQKVLIVTDAFMAKAPLMAQLQYELRHASVTVFDQVQANPDTDTVVAALKLANEWNPDVIVALGGGSAIDAAKSIRFLSPRQVRFYVIPTTSGSGSEVTSYAVISDHASQSKVPLTSDTMLPDVAILDPEAVRTAPPKLTADSGMDAVSHAIEAYVAKDHSDFSDAMAEKSLQLLCQYLPLSYTDPDDLTARERVHNAATMAGLAFNNAGLGIVHSISHAIGGRFPLPHGRLNSMILPHVIGFNAGPLSYEAVDLTPVGRRYAHLGLVVDVQASTPGGRVLGLISDCVKLSAKLHLPTTVSAAGVDKQEFIAAIPRLAHAALHDRCTSGNPVPVDINDIETILRQIA